jgi:hypothetical protein
MADLIRSDDGQHPKQCGDEFSLHVGIIA